MRKISLSAKVLSIVILNFVITFIMNNHKTWDYNKATLIEKNPEWHENHPVTDTLYGLYGKKNPIFVRSGFKINGHDKIGVCTGGSQLWFECSDNCVKCK